MNEQQRAALAELTTKSIADIQRETAYTWAYRAWAARNLSTYALSQGDRERALERRLDSTEYEHEAVEHAALTGSDEVLHDVRRIVAE